MLKEVQSYNQLENIFEAKNYRIAYTDIVY